MTTGAGAARRGLGRAVVFAGIALGTFVTVTAYVNGYRPAAAGLAALLAGFLTWLLLGALAVAVIEVLRRHHRAIGRHGWRYGKRGAIAATRGAGAVARGAAARSRPWRARVLAALRARWASREHQPLMFGKLRGNGQHIIPSNTITEGTSPMTANPSYKGGGFGIVAGSRGRGDAGAPAGGSRIAPEHRARRAAARTGAAGIPSEWAAVVAQTADFEPDSDAELLDWMGRQVTGLSAWAEALVDTYEHCTNVIGIDPAASAMLHDVADAAAQAAETMGAAKARFTEHYELPREFAANGGLMTHDGRWVTGEGA